MKKISVLSVEDLNQGPKINGLPMDENTTNI